MRTVYFEKNIPKVLLTMALRPIWPNVVYSSLSPTRFVDVSEPSFPGPRWVRVRNHLCGICATDLHLLLVQTDPHVAPGALPGNDRRYLGHELMGEVTEVGPEVSVLQVGDRVILDPQASTCAAQQIEPLCRHCAEGNVFLCENASLGLGPHAIGSGWGDSMVAHESALYKVPDELDDETAAMIEPLSVGVRAALRRLPQPGEKALVVGCGTTGLATIEALRALSPDCHVTAMARYPQQIDMARKLGAHELIVREDPYVAAARMTGGKLYTGALNNRMVLGGFDVVYDCVGSQRTVQDSLRWARARGAVVLVGVSFERMHLDLTPVWYQEVDLIGLHAHGMEERHGARQSTYDLTTGMLLEHKLTAEGFVTHRFPLDQWRAATRIAADKRSGAIKVMLDYRPG